LAYTFTRGPSPIQPAAPQPQVLIVILFPSPTTTHSTRRRPWLRLCAPTLPPPHSIPSMSPHLGPSAGGGRASFSPHSVYDRQQPRPTNSPSRTRALPPAPASPVSTRPPGLLARPRSGIEVSTPVGRWRVASEVAVRERAMGPSRSGSHGARARRKTERTKRHGANTNRFFTQRWQNT
jgi:hypothetical protein